MSYQRQPKWTPRMCERYTWWLHAQLEMEVSMPSCRPCKGPDGRDGLVVEWLFFTRQVELYQSWDGHYRVLRRDGAPIAEVVCDKRTVLDEVRAALEWMDERQYDGAYP